jgi:hypothetical protein
MIHQKHSTIDEHGFVAADSLVTSNNKIKITVDGFAAKFVKYFVLFEDFKHTALCTTRV